jgi:hypothetical protein
LIATEAGLLTGPGFARVIDAVVELLRKGR